MCGSLTAKMMKKATFSSEALLTLGRNMADALHYLHAGIHPGAMLLHR